MQNENLPASFESIRQKIDALKTKISLQKSLSDSILNEFDSLKYDFDSLKTFIESTYKTIDVTSRTVDVTKRHIDTTSGVYDARNKPTDSTLLVNESSSRMVELKKWVIDSSKDKLKINYYRPNIPCRMTKILNELIDKKKLSIAQMKTLTGSSRISLTRDMSILKKLGWVKFNGSRNNGYFTLTEDGEKIFCEFS